MSFTWLSYALNFIHIEFNTHWIFQESSYRLRWGKDFCKDEAHTCIFSSGFSPETLPCLTIHMLNISTWKCNKLWVLMRAQSYLTLWDAMDYSLPGSYLHGIFQARILGCHFLLQWFFQPRDQTHFSCVSYIGRQVLDLLSHQGSPILGTFFG